MLIRKVIGRYGAVKWVTEDGHIFRVRRRLKDKKKVYMTCHNRECSGSSLVLQLNSEVGEVIKSDAGHTPGITCRDEHFLEIESLRRRIIERAANENTAKSVIFQEEISRAPVEIRNRLNFKTMERSMQRAHHSLNPPTPKSFGEFAQSIQYWSERFGTINDQPFFVGKFGTGGDECLIAVVNPIVNSGLEKTADIHLDGTFKCRPKEPRMAQLFVIMCSQYGRAFPIVWALMSSRAASAYNVLFENVKVMIPGLKPRAIMSDYEKGLRESVKIHFPDSNHVGCWFHFSQAIARKAKKEKIRPGENDGWKVAKSLMATALLPASRALEAVLVIEEFADNSSSHREASKKMIEYFKRQWMEKVTPRSFSVYGQPQRTNNSQESLNRALNRTITPQGNTWDFWVGLRTVSIKETNYFTQLSRGNECTRKQKLKWLLQDTAIKNLQLKLQKEEISLGNFIFAAGYRVANNEQNSWSGEEEEEEDVDAADLVSLDMEANDDPEQEEILHEEDQGADEEDRGAEQDENPNEYFQREIDELLKDYKDIPTSLNPRNQFEMCTSGFVERQVSHLLASLEEQEQQTLFNEGGRRVACLFCTTYEASRLSIPCGHWVGCYRCICEWVRNRQYLQLTNANGTISTEHEYPLPVRCPVCLCLIGKLQKVFN